MVCAAAAGEQKLHTQTRFLIKRLISRGLMDAVFGTKCSCATILANVDMTPTDSLHSNYTSTSILVARRVRPLVLRAHITCSD